MSRPWGSQNSYLSIIYLGFANEYLGYQIEVQNRKPRTPIEGVGLGMAFKVDIYPTHPAPPFITQASTHLSTPDTVS